MSSAEMRLVVPFSWK